MKLKTLALSLLTLTTLSLSVSAVADVTAARTVDSDVNVAKEANKNFLDELNPFDPNIEQFLDYMDGVYENETGLPTDYSIDFNNLLHNASNCYRSSCRAWANVVKSEQKMYLYVDGQLRSTWLVSTGARGTSTPNFDKHPNGRVYTRYTSKKFPGGDYNGLGNMPYAVFIHGGFAIHGTGRGNWSKLGRVASHGCIRLHPDNAKIFNSLVKQNGINNVWITVQ